MAAPRGTCSDALHSNVWLIVLVPKAPFSNHAFLGRTIAPIVCRQLEVSKTGHKYFYKKISGLTTCIRFVGSV